MYVCTEHVLGQCMHVYIFFLEVTHQAAHSGCLWEAGPGPRGQDWEEDLCTILFPFTPSACRYLLKFLLPKNSTYIIELLRQNLKSHN